MSKIGGRGKLKTMCYRLRHPMFVFALLLICGSAASVLAQDVLVLEKNGGGESSRKGEIVQWSGDTISIKGKTGVKDFDTSRMVRFETAWHPGYQEGKQLQADYRYAAAINQYATAIENEPREWMQNIVHARACECFMAIENFDGAASQFLQLIDDDPQSRFRHLVPLVWTSSRPKKNELTKAQGWLESAEPMLALLGASWLLDASPEAQKKMQQLSRDFDPTVAALATAQLWRLEKVAPNEKRLALRIDQTRAMPEKVRCGAWYLIAEAQANTTKSDEAIVNFMRIVSNDPQQGLLVPAALYQAAWMLGKTNLGQQSQAMRNELKEKFGDTIWAQ